MISFHDVFLYSVFVCFQDSADNASLKKGVTLPIVTKVVLLLNQRPGDALIMLHYHQRVKAS
jgi:hypothetical protein